MEKNILITKVAILQLLSTKNVLKKLKSHFTFLTLTVYHSYKQDIEGISHIALFSFVFDLSCLP